MKKQPFFLAFALLFTFFTYLVSAPTRVNAGPLGSRGISEDSTSSSGDNFNPGGSQSPVEGVPGVNVEFSPNGSISVSTEVQNSLNEIARIYYGQLQPVTSTQRLIPDFVIVQNGESPSVNIQKLSDAITTYNDTVMKSSPEVLQQLAKDPQFLQLGNLLKQLRAALKKS